MHLDEMMLSIFRVLLAGLAFGAGLPALFALGIRLRAAGRDEVLPDGSVSRGNKAALAGAAAIIAIVVGVVIVGVLWITQKSLYHYLGISLFGMS